MARTAFSPSPTRRTGIRKSTARAGPLTVSERLKMMAEHVAGR